jgi:hypothetical protein
MRTDVSEERVASILRVKRIRELGTTLAVTSNFEFHKMLGKYRVAAQLVASRVALSSTQLVS